MKDAKVPVQMPVHQDQGAKGSSLLQAKADASPHVAHLNNLSQLANAGTAQRKNLLANTYKPRRGKAPLRTKGVKTSIGFDTNHLVSGGVTPDISQERLAARRPIKPRNTVVSEAQMTSQVTAKLATLVAKADSDETVSLDFPSGTAYQTVRNDSMQSGFNTAESNTIKVKAGASGRNYIKIFHLEESDFVMNAENEDLFPALPSRE